MKKQNPVGIFAIRKGRRLAVSTQQDAAIAAGYDPARFYNLDDLGIEALIGDAGGDPMLRRGNKLGVYRYEFLVPAGKSKGDRTVRAALKKLTYRLLELGIIVEEIETGRSCKDENGVFKIYADAVDRLAGTRKHDSPGRPKEHDYSDADCQLIEATWHREEYTNPKQREAAIQALVGEDGKPKFPKFKVSTWYTLRTAGRVK